MTENIKSPDSLEPNVVISNWKDWFDASAPFVEAISSLAWPVIFIALLFFLRKRLEELISVAVNKIKMATEIEFKGIKIKGARISDHGEVIRTDGVEAVTIAADKTDLDVRDEFYSAPRNLMLVHTIRPSEPERYMHDLRVFDVSVYIATHRNRGKLNDIKRVTYYFGKVWGTHEFGSKYVVESANDNFALTAQMWGACICTATIEFNDNSKSYETYRYLDVEMAPVYGIPLKNARIGTP